MPCCAVSALAIARSIVSAFRIRDHSRLASFIMPDADAEPDSTKSSIRSTPMEPGRDVDLSMSEAAAPNWRRRIIRFPMSGATPGGVSSISPTRRAIFGCSTLSAPSSRSVRTSFRRNGENSREEKRTAPMHRPGEPILKEEDYKPMTYAPLLSKLGERLDSSRPRLRRQLRGAAAHGDSRVRLRSERVLPPGLRRGSCLGLPHSLELRSAFSDSLTAGPGFMPVESRAAGIPSVRSPGCRGACGEAGKARLFVAAWR